MSGRTCREKLAVKRNPVFTSVRKYCGTKLTTYFEFLFPNDNSRTRTATPPPNSPKSQLFYKTAKNRTFLGSRIFEAVYRPCELQFMGIFGVKPHLKPKGIVQNKVYPFI